MNVLIFTDINGIYGYGRGAGPYRVATELRKHGFSAKVVEFFASYTINELYLIIDKYVDAETLYVGFSTSHFAAADPAAIKDWLTTYSKNAEHRTRVALFPFKFAIMQEIFSYVKRRNPQAKIVVGGHKVENTNNFQGVDYWVWGEGDLSALELARHLQQGGTTLKKEKATTGERILSKRDYAYDEFASSKIIWTEDDHLFTGEHLPIEIARGCAFNCSYCYFSKKKPGTYIKSADIIRAELIENYERFGTTGYMFSDDTYNDSIQKVTILHEVFTSLPFQIEWSAFARLDMLYHHPDMGRLLLESGARSIFFGIETFHPLAAKKIGKPLDPNRVKETLYRLKELWCNRVLIAGGFIVGLPEEPEDSIRSTFNWLSQPDCPLDAFSMGALTVRNFDSETSDLVVRSKFSQNPENYGIEGIAGKFGLDWKHGNMTRQRAEEIVIEYSESDVHRNRNRVFGCYTAYSRMRNLGYQFEDIYSHLSLASNWFDDHEVRRLKIREAYVARLLA